VKRPLPEPLRCVLFDLDGTLVDSAPDMYAALVALCAEQGVAAPDFERVRSLVSRGARAVLRSSFPDDDDAALVARVPRYLDIYAGMLDGDSRLFDGVAVVLDTLDARGIAWGVVTNKPTFLSEPLLDHLQLTPRMAALVCGDTLPQRKPDPEPLLHACKLAGADPRHTAYVGDDARDIEAADRADLHAIAAAWGYLDGGDPRDWQPDAIADDPHRLLALLGLS
jgi:phosphoglycolate phosphatase